MVHAVLFLCFILSKISSVCTLLFLNGCILFNRLFVVVFTFCFACHICILSFLSFFSVTFAFIHFFHLDFLFLFLQTANICNPAHLNFLIIIYSQSISIQIRHWNLSRPLQRCYFYREDVINRFCDFHMLTVNENCILNEFVNSNGWSDIIW